MTPFQQFRSWLREGPRTERTMTAIAAGLVLLLVVWAIAPTTSTTSTTSAGASDSAGNGSGTAAQGGTTSPGVVAPNAPQATVGGSAGAGTTQGNGGGAVAGQSSGGQPANGAGGKTQCPSGLASQGVTATTITIGVILVDLGQGGNAAIGIPSEADHEKAYRTLFDDVNAHGGVLCRKLVPKFYSDNVLDANGEQANCLQVQQDHPFAVINNQFNPQTITCIPAAKIPNYWYTPPHVPQLKKYYPYILSWAPDYDRLVKDYVRGAQAIGWFKGANKIGILDQSCFPDLSSDIRTELTAIGFPSSKWSVYNYGCSTTGQATPDQNTSAALQFKRDGVTHVMSVSYLASPGFASAAEQQQYKPKYAIMSDAQEQASDRSTNGPPQSFDGALDITTDQVGAENTPGYRFNAATVKCDQMMKGAGLTLPTDPNAGTAGTLFGVACVSTAMLVASLQHATALRRDALAGGLAAAGATDPSWPAGPAAFAASDPTGGQNWRYGNFHYSCNCWQVTDAKWRPGFK